MKKLLLVFISLLILSCQKTNENIPSSMRATKEEVHSVLKKESSNSKISVEKIDYVENGNSTISFITYSIDGKIYNNIAIARGTGMININKKLYSLLLGVTIKCVGDCTNTSGKCSIKGTYDPNTGTNTIECSCEGCVMEVNG